MALEMCLQTSNHRKPNWSRITAAGLWDPSLHCGEANTDGFPRRWLNTADISLVDMVLEGRGFSNSLVKCFSTHSAYFTVAYICIAVWWLPQSSLVSSPFLLIVLKLSSFPSQAFLLAESYMFNPIFVCRGEYLV